MLPWMNTVPATVLVATAAMGCALVLVATPAARDADSIALAYAAPIVRAVACRRLADTPTGPHSRLDSAGSSLAL